MYMNHIHRYWNSLLKRKRVTLIGGRLDINYEKNWTKCDQAAYRSQHAVARCGSERGGGRRGARHRSGDSSRRSIHPQLSMNEQPLPQSSTPLEPIPQPFHPSTVHYPPTLDLATKDSIKSVSWIKNLQRVNLDNESEVVDNLMHGIRYFCND